MKHDLIIRTVPGYGYLPIIVDYENDNELYRGEFQKTASQALTKLLKRSNELHVDAS